MPRAVLLYVFYMLQYMMPRLYVIVYRRLETLILSTTENVVLNIVGSFCHYPYCEFLVRLM